MTNKLGWKKLFFDIYVTLLFPIHIYKLFGFAEKTTYNKMSMLMHRTQILIFPMRFCTQIIINVHFTDFLTIIIDFPFVRSISFHLPFLPRGSENGMLGKYVYQRSSFSNRRNRYGKEKANHDFP